MGDPPPISEYCFWILGVLLLAMRGPRYAWSRPRGIRSPSACGRGFQLVPNKNGQKEASPSSIRTNSLLRNDSTSSVVDGPPMFKNTMAVGPFDPVAS